MNADGKSFRDSRLSENARLPLRAHQGTAKFVRLSQLRKSRECEQVAAVCYRVRGGEIEFLLVRTRGSGRWTFPKGSAEPGLTHAQAAALEAFEEAGVHGRIEEASFARYVRGKRGSERKTGTRSSEKELAVNAHLCEVSRLSNPKESGRSRTWFSAQEARLRLREGRQDEDGAEFARVVARAVARIQRLRGEAGIFGGRAQEVRRGQHLPRWDAAQKDGLQKVQFDFAEVCGRPGEASFGRHIRRRRDDIRRFSVPFGDAPRGEVLPCEVLEFSPRREKKVKALGNGTTSG
jgi:8-oxo-dGTP pyrophosphatase MutT (NUDIX family)